MKKIYITLTLLVMMIAQQAKALPDQLPPKSECQKAFESCKEASIKLPEQILKITPSLASLCEDCKKKCSKEKQEICKKAVEKNPKEKENFDGLNVYIRNCNNVCH